MGNLNISFDSRTMKIGYPCRCGIDHSGDYALEDRNHHECFHDATLVYLPAGSDAPQVICPICGMSWRVALYSAEISKSPGERKNDA